MNLSEKIIQFWFESPDLSQKMDRREIWFRSTPEFDQAIHDKFGQAYEDAAAGRLDDMKEFQLGCLALILLLDQFPRNLFRNNAKAFDTDSKACELARHALEHGYDQGLNDFARAFFYLPFEHSEELTDQKMSVKLFSPLESERSRQASIDHHDAIVRFGRFPHRNAVLGRKNTPKEEEYLKNPPTWGMTAAEIAEAEKTD